MRRGEVWWAEFDERRPVVLLSGKDPSGFQASAAKLSEIDDALRASEQRAEWTPAAAARLSEIKDSLRRRAQEG
jgi:hypothetical protein